MKSEIRVPSVGESVQEAVLVEWYKQNGEQVVKDEPLFLIETDKVTLEVAAETDGVLEITVGAGETVAIGAVVGFIESGAKSSQEKKAPAPAREVPAKEKKSAAAAAKTETPLRESAAGGKPEAESAPALRQADGPILSPAVRRLVAQKDVDIGRVPGSGPGGRVTKGDVWLYLEKESAAGPRPKPGASDSAAPAGEKREQTEESKIPAFGKTTRKPMSPIRRRIAERLLQARQQTAMLTTFNEIDMSRVMAIRSTGQEAFRKKHGVSLGLMSFFIKAAVSALKEFAQINAFIEDSDIVYHDYYHIGVAVGSERGLVVPVIRDADRLSYARLEKSILDFVERIKENRLKLADLEGGTFTISNGGVYGSLLSTPILNMPQSAILGMHKIEKRPVAVDDKVVIRPMMYVALSYDHRMVDGREAVSFLKHIKEWIEHPQDPFEEA